MLTLATQYSDVSNARRGALQTGGAPAVVRARARLAKFRKDWVQNELRTGGFFDRYIRREKANVPAMERRIAQRFHNARPARWRDLPKPAREIEAELQFAVSRRTYLRMREMDPHFWDDVNNLKSLKRDNPDACIWV